jgi:pimeloyl-ACP methyl ester carboxylesterase
MNVNRPHPTAADLATARQRYDAEARPGEFQTGRYKMRYVRWGAGTPVVFVHGLCDHPKSFCLLMAELVDRGYEVFCYHLANGQDDDAKLKTYTHDDFVEDLVAFLDHCQLGPVFVKGSSFGSTITLAALLKHPSRFNRVVLQGGFAYRKISGLEKNLSKMGRGWHFRMRQLPGRKVVMGLLEKPQFVGCPPEIVKYLAECSGDTPVSAAAHRGLILSELDLRPKLKDIPHPVLMIGGDRDTIVPRDAERTVEEGVPNVKRVEFSPCGHYPQYTMPSQMAEEMDRFYKHA